MRLTVEDVEKAVWVREVGTLDGFEGDAGVAWEELTWGLDDQFLVINGVKYPYEIVEQVLDGTWEYDTRLTIKVNGQYFTKTGYFQSHIGNDWDGGTVETFPTEVTTVEYLPR